MVELLKCSRCGQTLPENSFWVDQGNTGRHGRKSWCRACYNHRRNQWRHERGIVRPLADAKDSPTYLGCYVAERVLANYFDHVERMPYGNPGYDFICGRGFKIDAKSSCLRYQRGRSPRWQFNINRNKVADHFLCLGFDNRDQLNPKKIWLIPGIEVSNQRSISIGLTSHRFDKYEKPIDKVIACCNAMKNDPA